MYLKPELEYALYKTIVEAGIRSLDFYKKNKEISYKADSSPVTAADIESNRIITDFLKKTEYPILSEESAEVKFDDRKEWEKFWMVDPLDGTKEFIAGGSDYTINIALIENCRTVFGLVYLPVQDLLYIGDTKSGAYKIEATAEKLKYTDIEEFKSKLKPRKRIPDNQPLYVVASKSHLNSKTETYINNLKKKFPDLEFKSYGSSLKLCILADGQADLYPRMGPTMEWDIAAGHAVLKAAGGEVISLTDRKPLKYNKIELLNSEFIAYSPSTLNMPDIKDQD